MTPLDISGVSDEALQRDFIDCTDYNTLVANATPYKDSLMLLLSSKDKGAIRPLLRKFVSIQSCLQKGKILQAFGDLEGATDQYKSIRQGQDGYDEALYRLLILSVGSTEGGIDLQKTISLVDSIDSLSPFHGFSCMLVGDILYKQGQKQEALEWYLKVDEEHSPDYKMAQNFIRSVSAGIEEVTLGEGKLILKKGYPFGVAQVHLDNIEHIVGRGGRGNTQSSYVISLSENDKLTFQCTPFANIGNGSFTSESVQLADLDGDTRPSTMAFTGLCPMGELIFRSAESDREVKIPLDLAQKSLREKDGDYTNESEDVLAWEEADQVVYIIEYDEDHPLKLLKNGKEIITELNDYESAISYWTQIDIQFVEYSDAQYNIALAYLERFRNTKKDEYLIKAHEHSLNVKSGEEESIDLETLLADIKNELEENEISV